MKSDRRPSIHDLSRQSLQQKDSWNGPPFNAIYAGIAARFHVFSTRASFAIAVRDSSYLLDFAQYDLPSGSGHQDWSDFSGFVLAKLREYQEEHLEKFIGVAMQAGLAEKCPELCSRLWLELDIIPIVLRKAEEHVSWGLYEEDISYMSLDEQAESIARKCIRFFGPSKAPIPEIGFQGLVEVDAAFHVRLTRLADYEKTVRGTTWNAVNNYASDLKRRRVKIAFFSATPQGGGVALMRHAMVRFARAIGVDLRWYVPKPRRSIFRVTKNNHNILQGVAPAGTRFTKEDRDLLCDWVLENARRYWLRAKGGQFFALVEKFGPQLYPWLAKHGPPPPPWIEKNGPLVPPWEGGADVIIIDDPQLPFLIPFIKEQTPDRPVIFRSHIQIRSDLTDTPGTPQAEAWGLLWDAIKQADLFISHPVRAFVPKDVPQEKLGYLPASTDWLDGLNKPMTDWTASCYGRVFNAKCRQQFMTTINYPDGQPPWYLVSCFPSELTEQPTYWPTLETYIVQVARFDPSKGIRDVLRSYELFHRRLVESCPGLRPPKLLICGHGSVDDPDGSLVWDDTLDFIEQHLKHLQSLICVMRIDPSDQMLHTLLSRAKVVLQLSTREGFEVKVSEALHAGKPVIATRAGGIPLQIQHAKNGFLVDISDTNAVAEHLLELWTDSELYDRMSSYAAKNVSDEVSTVGNTLSWLYLASKLSKGERIRPNGSWINDLAREEANEPYQKDENRLQRVLAT